MNLSNSGTLGEVAELLNGKTPSKAEHRDEGHAVLKIKDVSELGEFRGTFASFVDHQLAENFASKQIRDGDTLILNAAHNADYVGSKTFRAQPPTFGALATGEWLIVRPFADKLHPGFAHHWVNSPRTRRAIRDMVKGIHLYPKDVARLRIPLPPLPEQRQIAQLLDKADALRAKRRSSVAKLDMLIQSIFVEMFGDGVAIPSKWPQESLETFFHFRTGKLDSNAAVASGKYPFFTCSREDFRIDKFAFDCEALLLAGNNASADYSVKHYKGKFNAYQRTYVITLPNERNSYEYARVVLEQRLAELKRISRGTGTKYLTLESLNRIRVPVPPQELQREFARRVNAVEKIQTSHRTSSGELNALFAALQDRAFRGEL
jgi:type I restriction enzyme, S subunit